MNKLAALILASTCLTACTTIPAVNERAPSKSAQTTVGVGDAVYVYKHVPAHMYDTIEQAARPLGGGYKLDVTPNVQSLTYSGIANDRLVFDYSQSGPMIGSQNATAQYDYQVGGKVVYKGAEITVLNADNLSITYVVEQGFSNETGIQ